MNPIALLLLAGAILFARYGPALWGRYLYVSRVRQLQTQCLAYTPAADKIVYDTAAADRSKLLASEGYRPFNQWSVFTTPAAWHAFRGAYACPDGTAFLHARQAPSGPERLVSVDIIPTAADVVWLRWTVSDLVPLLNTAGIEQSRKTLGETTIRLDAHGRPLRLYAGQVDPIDSAAFTIRGAFGAEPFQVDGRLLESGQVELRPHPTAGGGAMTGITSEKSGPDRPGFGTIPSVCRVEKP